jgi:asparagine synthase (glutamine-hydrolysing)
MCGITGFLDFSPSTNLEVLTQRISAMTSTLSHRGPDGEGVWVDQHAGIALGHRRLSILDVSDAGSQPMQSACGRYVLISNGEIYNFRALRAELEVLGCVFRGSGDTEVMLAAISIWGVRKAIEKCNGMFAFALWDRQLRRLHLGRDRIGEKPLYAGWAGRVFLFGSELKALRRHPDFQAAPDRNSLALFIRYCCIPAPWSIYQGINKILPGTIVTIGEQGQAPHAETYWSTPVIARCGVDNSLDSYGKSLDSAVEEFGALLADSVKLRLESDRPFGAFLSGGVDSSTIVALMQQVTNRPAKTFTIGFEEADEAVYARAVSAHLGTDHTERYISSDDALRVIPELPRLYDEPFSDSSQIPTFLISQLARESVTVVLTGDAGDELFGGYGRYRPSPKPLPPIHTNGVTDYERIRYYQRRMSTWADPESLVLGSHEPATLMTDPANWLPTDDLVPQMMLMDSITYLPDELLVKLDRAAMAVGLEPRTPFLDHRLIEFSWRLPMDMKIRDGVRKWILRQLLYRHVPPFLIERPKQGFEIPLSRWLRNGLREWAESLLDEQRLTSEGFFDARQIREKWESHLSGDDTWKHFLWSILMFEAWLEQS